MKGIYCVGVKELDDLIKKHDNRKLPKLGQYSGAVPDDIYGVFDQPAKVRKVGTFDEENFGLKAIADNYRAYSKKIEGDANKLIQTIDSVDAALEQHYSDLDADQKTIGIDLELDKFFGDLDTQQAALAEHNNRMIALTERTANAMEQNFSDLFFDAFTGKMNGLSDYFEGILNSMLRAYSDFLGQMAAQGLFGQDYQGGGWLSSLSKWIGGGFSMAGGGYIGENVVGIGQSTGQSYMFHANEYVVPQGKVAGGGNVEVDVIIHNDGQPVKVTKQSTSFDGARAVAELWIEAHANNVAGLREYAG